MKYNSNGHLKLYMAALTKKCNMNINKYDCVRRLIGVLYNQYIYIMLVYVFSDM